MTDPAKPSLDLGEFKPDLTAQTPADQLTYGGWSPLKSNQATGCPAGLVLGPAISSREIASGKIECTLPPPASFTRGVDIQDGKIELGEPTLVAHEAVRIGADHYLIPARELEALRADRERLKGLIDFLNHYCLFAAYVKLRCPGATTSEFTTTVEEWRAAIDDAIQAHPTQRTPEATPEDVQK